MNQLINRIKDRLNLLQKKTHTIVLDYPLLRKYRMFFVTSMVMLPLLCFLIVYLDRRVDRYLKNINTLQADQVEKNEYVHEIEKTIQIPQNSSATVGVVKDVESLKRLKKITKVSEGNVVLLFETMSIVYDPVNDTIIDISSNEK